MTVLDDGLDGRVQSLCFQVAFVKESGTLVSEPDAENSALLLASTFLRN